MVRLKRKKNWAFSIPIESFIAAEGADVKLAEDEAEAVPWISKQTKNIFRRLHKTHLGP